MNLTTTKFSVFTGIDVIPTVSMMWTLKEGVDEKGNPIMKEESACGETAEEAIMNLLERVLGEKGKIIQISHSMGVQILMEWNGKKVESFAYHPSGKKGEYYTLLFQAILKSYEMK